MSHGLRSLSATACAVALAGLCAAGSVRAQGLPADVLKIDRFASLGVPWVEDLDGSIRISNPGSPTLRAWGTHIEVTNTSTEDAFTSETAFQDTPLSSAELDELTERCGDIFDNGSGAGRCSCRREDGVREDGTSRGTKAPEPGTLCANLYVFAADQQLTECCSCPVTPNGLLTLSVRDDLNSNPLTGDVPDRGVVALLTSVPGATSECDPTVPTLPSSPTTTTTTIPTPTSTTTTTTTTSTTIPGETTTTTSTTTSSTTSTTMPSSGSGATTTAEPAANPKVACGGLSGLALLDCAVGTVGVDPGCDGSAMKPSVQKLVLRRMNAMMSRVQGADRKGGKALGRALNRADRNLGAVQKALVKEAKHRKLTASCLALLQSQLGGVQGALTALK
jgi:hypothetical protein